MSDNKIVIIADSTQISAFLECEQLWAYGHKERLGHENGGPSEAMLMGTYGHFLLDHFYKGLTYMSRTNSMKFALEQIPPPVCLCGHAQEKHELLGDFHFCHDCTCEAWDPQPFPLDPVIMFQVKERVKLYIFTHSNNNDFSVEMPEHSEVGFSECIFENEHRQYILEGRIDLYNASLQGTKCIADHKFQLRKHALYRKSVQFRNYAMVGNAKLFIVNYIRFAKAVNDETFQRDVASFTDEEHRWWRKELIRIYDRMSVARENNCYEQNWSACAGKYGYACDFAQLCEERNPDIKDLKKETLYQIKQEWKPW